MFAATHAEILRWVDEGAVDGLRVDHPDGLSDPGGYARRLRAAIGPDRWLVVEKILGVGEALPDVVAGRRHVGLRGAAGGPGRVRGPGRRGRCSPSSRPSTPGGGSRCTRPSTPRGARWPTRSSWPRCAASPRSRRATTAVERAREAVAELLCGFPVYRSYLPEGRAALDAAVSVARTHRPDLADVLDGLYAAMLADPRGELATRVAADLRHGDGQGRRGHHVLPVEPVRRAQRGRRRARPLRRLPRRVPRRGRGAGRGQARDHDHALDARHQALARTCGPASPCSPRCPGEWTDRVRRWSARHPLPERSLELLAWQNLVGAWPIPAEPDGGLPHEGRRRRPSSSPATSRRCRRWTRRSRPGPRRCSPTPSWSPRSRSSSARISAPGWSNSLGQKLLQLAGPGGARRLPGHRSLRVLAGRPGQPQAGRLGGAARPARPTRRGLAARRRRGGGGEAAGHDERAAAAPLPAGGVHRVPRRCPPTGPPPRTPWRSSGRRRWSRWRPGCRSGWPPAAGGATRCSRCPTAPRTGTTSSPTPPSTGPHPGSRELLARYPVALLVRPA